MSGKKRLLKLKALLNKSSKIKMPALRLRYRLSLYLLTVIFVILSLVQVMSEAFGFIVGNVIYMLAALTLFSSCYYLAVDMRYGVKEKIKPKIETNPFTSRIARDYRYRTVTFAVPGLVINVIFALFNGAIGIYSRSPWYGTLSAYYILLSAMRFMAVRYDRKVSKREEGKELLSDEIFVYHKCGILFLIMAIALGGMVILMVSNEGGKSYPGFLIYAVAAYTFYKITLSIINLVKARGFESPLLMAIRDIGYIDACVSILSLQTAMFASFGNRQEIFTKLMNGITGSAVFMAVLFIGIYSIYSSNKMKRNLLSDTGGVKNDKDTCGRG